jgi:hypothetical protein
LLPRNQLIHLAKEEFFVGLMAFAGKFGIGKRELLHAEEDWLIKSA